MASNFILLWLSNFSYKRGRKPLGRLPLKRVLTLEEIFSLTNLLHLEMTGKKTVEKGKKLIASSNTPTPMTSDGYAMDAGFTLVTRSKARLSKKQAEVITLTRPLPLQHNHLPLLHRHLLSLPLQRDLLSPQPTQTQLFPFDFLQFLKSGLICKNLYLY